MIFLLTLAAGAYLHAHPDAFYLAGTVSVLMYLACALYAVMLFGGIAAKVLD